MYRKRRRYPKRRSAIKKLKKDVSILKKSVETKFLDTIINQTNLDWSGFFTNSLAIPEQGLFDYNRSGDKIFGTSAQIRLRVAQGSAGLNTHMRVIGVWDKYNTIASADDLLYNQGSGEAPCGHYNRDTRREWVKLFDINFMLETSLKKVHTYTKSIKLNKEVHFNNNSTTINKGRFVIYFVSNIPSGSPSANLPDLTGIVRFRYNDL